MRRHLVSLWRDQSGATIVEFALIAPALFVLLFGVLDMAHNMYVAQMLHGAIQDAARDSTIEGASVSEDELDAHVTKSINALGIHATPVFSRKSYSNFTGVSRPEDWDDLDGNNICDNGEPFEDANFNATWDLDPGSGGFGGARDAVLYTVTVDYDRLFPVYALIPGQTKTMTMSASTVLRNQPFGLNMRPPVIVRNCTA